MADQVIELRTPYSVRASVGASVTAASAIAVAADPATVDISLGETDAAYPHTPSYTGTWPSVFYRNYARMSPNFIRGYVFSDVYQTGDPVNAGPYSVQPFVSLYRWDGSDWELIDSVDTVAGLPSIWEFELTDFATLHKLTVDLPVNGYVTTGDAEYEFTPVEGDSYFHSFGISGPTPFNGLVYHDAGFPLDGVDLDIFTSEDGYTTAIDTVTTDSFGYWSYLFEKTDEWVAPITIRVKPSPSVTVYTVLQPSIGYVDRTLEFAGYESDVNFTLGTLVSLSTNPSTIELTAIPNWLGSTEAKPDVKRIVTVNKKRQRKRKGSYHFAHSTITPFDTESLGTATGSITLGQIKATLTGDADQLIVDSTNEYKMGRIRISGSAHLSRRVGVLQDPRLNIIRRVHPIKET